MTALSLRRDGTSPTVEVRHISAHGLWLLAGEAEMFMAFEEFPWFKDAPVAKILNVEEPSPGHYYWPDLDVDLSAQIIANPGGFPLVAK